jgi:hypothetical protein
MNKMQDWLLRAARELGVRIEVNFVVKLPSGRELASQAHFPDFCAPMGLLVFRWEDDLASASEDARMARAALAEMGYAVSTFDEPSEKETFDIAGYVEMFSEWGWSGAGEQKPDWMT